MPCWRRLPKSMSASIDRTLATAYDPDANRAPKLFNDQESLADFAASDQERKDRLTTRDQNRSVEYFAARARSGFYASPKDHRTMLALDVFRRFAERDREAARIWPGKLRRVSQSDVHSILAGIPSQRMSPVTREFTLKLLMINQRRLLECLPS
jgi:hypothetical protein